MSCPEHEQLKKKFPDVDPFLLKKWERVFNYFFDRNASDAVDWGDFYLVVRKCRDIYGAQSEQMKYARAAMKSLWDGLKKAADTNKDNVVSLEEWCEVLHSSDPNNQSKWFQDYCEFMFKLFDVSADGKVDLFEYTDGMHAHGFEDSEAQRAFKLFALDWKNAKPIEGLDKEMWARRFMECFYSTDKNAPGNHLFGKLPDDF